MPEPTVHTETWIGATPEGVVLARTTDGEVLVDRPSRGRFREAGPDVPVDVAPVVDGVRLVPVAPLPADLPERSGWYDGADHTVLLTHFPESYFGEPMILLGQGDRVSRAYALDGTHLLAEDGTTLELVHGGLVVDGERAGRSSRLTESQIAFTAGDVRLSGTVIVPPGEGPHPAAVLLHGAAGGQRDWCRLQAGALLDAGVAVLIYDKAGHGASGGSEPSIFDQADAGEAAMQALASLPVIAASRIGLAGFSNGMWAAPIIAARRPVAFVVGAGAPGVSMAEAEVHRRVKVLRDAGVGPEALAATAESWRCIFSIVADGHSDEVVARLGAALDAVRGSRDLERYEVPDYVRENPMLSPIPPPLALADLVPMLTAEQDPQVSHDPAGDYARITCPVFLQYGADDTSVPVEASARAVRVAAPQAEVRVYPGLEHMLNVVPEGVVGLSTESVMYQFHQFRFGAGVWAELTDWLRATVTSPRRPVGTPPA